MSTIEFQNLLNKYYTPLSYFALKLTSNEEDAKDLLQETMYKALRYKDRLFTHNSLKSWLYTIMKNTFINNYRRNVKRKTFMDYLEDIPVDLSGPSMDQANPMHSISVKEIRAVIDGLEDEYRIPFTMKIDGYKYKEISEELDVPIGTVKSRIFIARQKMTAQLPEFKYISE